MDLPLFILHPLYAEHPFMLSVIMLWKPRFIVSPAVLSSPSLRRVTRNVVYIETFRCVAFVSRSAFALCICCGIPLSFHVSILAAAIE